MKNRIAIIGAGYTGLSCAKKLIENNYNVTIIESTDEIGGIAKCIDFNEKKIEKHYRHIFKSDKYVIDMIKEFDLVDKLHWNETKMAYYDKEQGLYAFGTPYTLLKYKPLTFVQKLLFGISVIKIKIIKNYKKIENYTAEEWIKKNCGEKVYKKIWEPLLITKFGEYKNKISMSWLWGKINLRSSSSTLEGERLGYLEGSFDILTRKLGEFLIKNNCKIELNSSVKKVTKSKTGYRVETDKNEEEFDYIINTTAYDISKNIFKEILTKEEKEKIKKMKYTSARTMIIFSKKSLTKYYWINIGDRNFPFGGIIEHTNMEKKDNYNNTNIIYISNYMYKNDRLYNLNENELFDEYLPFLQKINRDFTKEDVIKIECFSEMYAQPIIETEYSKELLNEKITSNGVFMATMAQIYPEDRGMNYAIKLGYEVAEKIINEKRIEN